MRRVSVVFFVTNIILNITLDLEVYRDPCH